MPSRHAPYCDSKCLRMLVGISTRASRTLNTASSTACQVLMSTTLQPSLAMLWLLLEVPQQVQVSSQLTCSNSTPKATVGCWCDCCMLPVGLGMLTCSQQCYKLNTVPSNACYLLTSIITCSVSYHQSPSCSIHPDHNVVVMHADCVMWSMHHTYFSCALLPHLTM